MPNPSPKIDSRVAPQVIEDLQAALKAMAPEWPESAPKHGAAAALMAIFARYCEIAIDRLNRAPERKMMAFLDRLGASQLPPQAARVPITFSLAAKAIDDVLAPKGTQVATAPTAGGNPLVYETEHDLVASVVRLDQLFVKEPAHDRFADRHALIEGPTGPAVAPFAGELPAVHALHIGHSTFFGMQQLQRLAVQFDFGSSLPTRQPQDVVWELADGANQIVLVPEADETAGFTKSGRVVFREVPPAAMTDLGSHRFHWLSCRCTGPFAGPLIFDHVTLDRRIQSPDRGSPAAVSNGTPVDLTKDFLPFGEKPRFGATFYLATDPVVSIAGMKVTVTIALVNPVGGAAPIPSVYGAGNAKVTWEFWNGAAWLRLGTGEAFKDVEDPAAEFSDSTRAFTQSGQVRFQLPSNGEILALGGVKSTWLRARLTGGDYGLDAAYVLKTPAGPHPEYVFNPATLSPPWVHSLTIGYLLDQTAEKPEALLSENDFRLREGPPAQLQRAAFEPFQEAGPALYMGLLPPVAAAGTGVMPRMGERPLRLYFLLAESVRAAKLYGGVEDASGLDWEYWNGSQWTALRVQDLTAQFTRSGPVVFISPEDWQPTSEFGTVRYWMRAVLTGKLDPMPLLRVLTNTIDARQTTTIANEVLGSSKGSPGQVFRTNRQPVLDGSLLEVRERDGWMGWQAVPHFYASAPDSRHYVIDRLTGSVQFGDGVNGRIPPAGSNNVRMTFYQTGGGSAGNQPAGSIVQLKTTLPSIEKVVNWRDAEGGADAETTDSMVERAPAQLRHRGRAVTAQDFEDLARAATPEVALVKCVPLRNLAIDPDGKSVRPGTVSVIIAPFSRQHRPLPSFELIQRVWSYLSSRQSAAVELVVVGPEYLAVEIAAEVILTSAERLSEIDETVQSGLADFLDPVSGGPDGSGWTFGRLPHRSDVFSIIHSVDGVDHVATLEMKITEQRPGAADTGRFLVCPGPVHIRYSLLQD